MSTPKLPNANTALYDVALECAARREYKKCRQREFLSRPLACSKCKHNIYKYLSGADPKDVSLVMYQAETTVCESRADARHHTRLTWLPILAVTVFFIFGIRWMQQRDLYVFTTPPKEVPATITTAQVDAALRSVAKAYDEYKTDVNLDGLVNCIDAAVLFYRYYNRPGEVQITINKNLSTGMNHLFNTVLINGKWVAIEPQAYVGGKRNYTMHSIWGRKYDQRYDRDATQEYEQFANLK